MRIRQTIPEEEVAINLMPLIDMVFLLLIFFLVATTFAQAEKDRSVNLPGSDSPGPSSLLVLADGDCRHETVVMALDAGNAVGIEHVRLATTDDMDY
ncbi:hypothetical protein LCGC14_2471330 [marine sediment metagenome]|uniref:Biopolymer transport protein ExbD/TolR n=1 Tax=marine sediment metagenome TaxID=412755 RepID=A0A0F9BY41_9ZZZZ